MLGNGKGERFLILFGRKLLKRRERRMLKIDIFFLFENIIKRKVICSICQSPLKPSPDQIIELPPYMKI